jgi:hypothetical protein
MILVFFGKNFFSIFLNKNILLFLSL